MIPHQMSFQPASTPRIALQICTIAHCLGGHHFGLGLRPNNANSYFAAYRHTSEARADITPALVRYSVFKGGAETPSPKMYQPGYMPRPRRAVCSIPKGRAKTFALVLVSSKVYDVPTSSVLAILCPTLMLSQNGFFLRFGAALDVPVRLKLS